MLFNLATLKPVGGYLRYGFSVYPWSTHNLKRFTGLLAFNPIHNPIQITCNNVRSVAKELSGGHNISQIGQVVLQENLCVFTGADNAWEVAFADKEETYLVWLEGAENMTYDFYKKELDSMPTPR